MGNHVRHSRVLTGILWFLATTIFLYLCFAKNIFWVVNPVYQNRFQVDGWSEGMVVITLKDDPYRTVPLSFLEMPKQWDKGGTINGSYVSLSGLQGMILARVRDLLGMELIPFYLTARSVAALMLAATLAVFVVSIAGEFGLATAALVAGALGLSPWLVCFAPNLYWVTFVMFLPFVATWVLYPARRGVPLYATIVLLVAIRCLCCYGYATTVVLSVAAPVFYWGGAKGRPLSETARDAAYALASGLAGCFLAIALHLTQLYIVFGRRGIDKLAERFLLRTAGAGGPAEEYGFVLHGAIAALGEKHWLIRILENHPILIAPYSLLWYLSEAAINLPGANSPNLTLIPGFLQIGVVVAAVVILAWRRRRQIFNPGRENALLLAMCVGLIAALSWNVVFVQHAVIHVHMNTIEFYIPFLPLAYLYFAARLTGAFNRRDATDSN